MSNDYDQSHIEKKYFIDGYKYNCPFVILEMCSMKLKTKELFIGHEKKCAIFI